MAIDSNRSSSNSINTPVDRGVLLAVFTLIGIGLVQVFSASYIFAEETRGDSLFFFKRQVGFAILSLIVLILAIRIPFRWVEKAAPWLWAFASLALFATFIPGIGVKAGGAGRWIQLGGFRFEPSEVLKVTVPLIFAWFLTTDQTKWGHWKWPARILIVLLPIATLLKQPDFGTFAITVAVIGILLFCYGLRTGLIVTGVLAAIPIFWVLVMSVPYRRARVIAFLDPWADQANKGFQVIQSMLSLYSGGLTGSGLGEAQGKLYFLPEAHTDFTLSVLGEESGFIGIALILLLYLFLIFRGFQLAARTERPFAQAVILGLITTFGIQVFINAGVVLGFLPTKGLTLPFLSYGGSSLIATALAFGLLLNAAKYATLSGNPNGKLRR